MPKPDPSTLSNYAKLAIRSADIKLKVNWASQTLSGSVKYVFDKIQASEIVLDTSFLKVSAARFDGEPAKFEFLPERKPLGVPLSVQVPNKASSGELSIDFETTEQCTALQWLKTEQTADKKAPYLFSQCQPIHARSLFPCFDTPSVKLPLDIEVTSDHPVVAGAIKLHDSSDVSKGVYRFKQEIPVPSYLFALAGGDLDSAPIGPRSDVYSEPSQLKANQAEFEQDMEKFLEAAEKIVYPYEWKTYDLLVLPPSFPFGGMENPNMTFVTPTLISGDRTLVNVVAHELAHSWSGNLVTNSSWEHFWLNEGWTVYLERRILGALHGEQFRHFQAIIGWKELEESVHSQGADNRFTALVIDMEGIDPDDAYSVVPYEKGSTFLFYLENLLGKPRWDKFVPFYFTKFKGKSLDTDDFIATLREFFTEAGEQEKLDNIDWKMWLHAPGMPPKPDFDTSLAEPCYKLADKWTKATETGDFDWASKKDLDSWNNSQLLVFLDTFSEQLKGQPHVDTAVRKIDELYEVSQTRNSEVKLRWYRLAIAARFKREYQPLADWIGSVGRMKYVRPGYRQLNQVDRELALETFKKHQAFYHPIARAMVAKDLGV